MNGHGLNLQEAAELIAALPESDHAVAYGVERVGVGRVAARVEWSHGDRAVICWHEGPGVSRIQLRRGNQLLAPVPVVGSIANRVRDAVAWLTPRKGPGEKGGRPWQH